MVSDHEDDIATFEDYVENGQDPDLRRFAEETLPTLQQQLDLARQTKEQVAAAGRAGAAGPRNGSRWGLEHGQPERRGGRHDHVVAKDDAHYAVLSVGGFLGLGEKNVAVPLDELKLSEDEAYLMSAQTEEQLEEMPEYEATQYQPDQR